MSILVRFDLLNILSRIFILTILSGTLIAQEYPSPDSLVSISLQDGTTLNGRIIATDNDTITLLNEDGLEITLRKSTVNSITPIKNDLVDGSFKRVEPNYSRLLFGPTGKTLNAGQGYISLLEAFFAIISYGLTDYITLNGGMSLILWTGIENQWYYLGTKIKLFSKDNLNVSGGIAYSKVPTHDDAAVIFNGVATYGTDKSAVTIGLGYGLSGGDSFANPILILGGELKIGRTTKLITENWIFGAMETYRFSLAVQFITKSLAADIGIVHPAKSEPGHFPFMPWVGLTYNF